MVAGASLIRGRITAINRPSTCSEWNQLSSGDGTGVSARARRFGFFYLPPFLVSGCHGDFRLVQRLDRGGIFLLEDFFTVPNDLLDDLR